MSIGHFDVLKAMCRRNMDVKLSPLPNVNSLDYSAKHNSTAVTIAIDGNVCKDIASGSHYGGLLLYNAAQYQEVLKELKLDSHLSGVRK